MAGFTIKGKIEGLKDVTDALKAVDKKLRKKLIRKAVGEGGKLILKRAKQLVPKDTGLLKKSLGRKVKVYKNGVAVAVVGPRQGFRKSVTRSKGRRAAVTLIANPVKYAHLVELGTQNAPAHPFLKPALDGQQAAIRDAMAGVIRAGLEQAGG